MGDLNLNIGSGYLALDGFTNIDNSIANKIATSFFYPLIKPFLGKSKRELIQLFVDGNKEAKIHAYDCRKKLKFKDSSVNHILTSHFLEHLFHDECVFVLKDCYRMLKPGGTLHIIVPDLEYYINEYKNNPSPEASDEFMSIILAYPKRGMSLRQKILDLRGDYGLHHLWMYDRKSMTRKLEEIGFKVAPGKEDTPSTFFREDDESLHVFCTK